MSINNILSLKKAIIYTFIIGILAACGGNNGESQNNSGGQSNNLSPNSLKATLSIEKKDKDYNLNLDLKPLISKLNLDNNSDQLVVEDCEEKDQPRLNDVIIKLKNDSITKIMFLPVACKNQINTNLYDLAQGNWDLEVIIYNPNQDKLLSAKGRVENKGLNIKDNLIFNYVDDKEYYQTLKKISDSNLAQEVKILPVDYMNIGRKSFIYLGSSEHDYIGAGQEYFYTSQEFGLAGYKNRINIKVNGFDNSNWDGNFALPDSYKNLSVGLFSNLSRYSFSNPKIGGLEWSGNGRGCNTSKSWMRVDHVTFENDALRSIDYRFAQHCENNPYSALFGVVHWTSPKIFIGTKWQPTLDSIPTGNYIALESDKGDYVGGGKDYLFNEANSNIQIDSKNNVLNLRVNGDTWWNANFALPDAKTKIEAGTYKNLMRYPFNNPKLGGLDWGGDGRGCNQLEGWFTVDTVQYDTAGLKAIDLRFEQHCEGAASALYGKIHWNREGI
ncbi:hypothetical protein ACNQO6_16610 [Acinetobacter calcoaceticus]|uniref:hypothetical protein n=1 Tax=Acinetobacter TaxID=469 RepID=UPI002B291757|nr:hypothetical protein SB581_17765 [Acinetobacter baumannii]